MKKYIKIICNKCGYIHYTDLFTDEIFKKVDEGNNIIICVKIIESWNCCINKKNE